MEIRFNKILYIILFCVVSCKDVAQKSNSTSTLTNKKNQEQIDFLDKKYFIAYDLVIDESTISDHPFYSYLDCNNEGYFSVHFVPKTESDMMFWRSTYYKDTDFNTHDFGKDSKKIGAIIDKNLIKYNIFSYFVGKKYLNNKNGCTVESVYLDKNSIAEIYLYNHQIKKWELVKTEKSNILPPYISSEFFASNFPELFPDLENEKDIVNKNIAHFYDYDLDRDGIKDKIILYINDKESGEFEREHFGLPMVIKKGLSNDTHQTWYENNYIIPKNNFNCAAEGFSKIVSNKNYFTIENQLCSNYILISTYTTFKIIENDIILHKYGETYFDKANHNNKIPSKTWQSKDFGNISFDNVTDDFLVKLSQTNPK